MVNRTKAYSGIYTGELLENGVVVYRGIQFATCGRFERPQVVPASDREIDALKTGPRSDGGDPDCLNLTLYVNPNGPRMPKAVFMWQYGSAQCGGTNDCVDFSGFVLEHPEIIVVCPNHRGQFFGSINLSSLEGYAEVEEIYNASNNLARLDLLACLKWIQENIEAFGGDKNRVTIGGHSSGSNNCTCLMLMEEAEPYFHRAACQASFAADTSLQTPENSNLVSKVLFEKIGVTTMKEILEIPAERINEAFKEIMGMAFRGEGVFHEMENKLMAPVIDNVVLFDDYYERLLSVGMSGKQLMIGHNSGEYDKGYDRFRNNNFDWEGALAVTIENNFGKLSNRGWNKEHAQEIIDTYFSHNEEYGRDNYIAAVDLKNDLMLRCDAYLYAEAIYKQADVYMYVNDIGIDHLQGIRISHGSENNLIALDLREVPEEFHKGAHLLSDIWAAFITTGDPNCEALPTTWEKFTRENSETMYMDDNSHMLQGFRQKDMELLLPLLWEKRKGNA